MYGDGCFHPKATRNQATAAYVYKGLVNQWNSGIMVAECILASDVELLVICMAVGRATALEDCDWIVIFTDSMAMAGKAVNLGAHSG